MTTYRRATHIAYCTVCQKPTDDRSFFGREDRLCAACAPAFEAKVRMAMTLLGIIGCIVVGVIAGTVIVLLGGNLLDLF